MKHRILGIDPGSQVTGYGVIDGEAALARPVAASVVRPRRGLELADRLLAIHVGVTEVIERFDPTCLAVETAFYQKNVRSAMVLGHVRGVILLAARQAGLPVHEYAPREIKMAVTGNGGAAKEQVSYMVCGMLRLKEAPVLDASDALAVALCHWQRDRVPAIR